jgi:hypothetical protein
VGFQFAVLQEESRPDQDTINVAKAFPQFLQFRYNREIGSQHNYYG